MTRLEVSWLRKGYGMFPRIKIGRQICALPKEDGNQLREYKAMHEENFLSSWLPEDVEGGKAEVKEWKEEAE